MSRRETGRAATRDVRPGQYVLSIGLPTSLPEPIGWAWTDLYDVAELASGHTPSRKHPEWWHGDIPWMNVGDARIADGKTITETKERTNAEGIANSAAVVLPPGTVCLSRTGSIGYSVLLGKEMATSQGFVNFIARRDALDPRFLQLLFLAERRALIDWSEGTAHTTIYFPEVKAFHICLPPLNEQHRIVSKIEALESHREAAQEALDAIPPLLEKFRQSVLAAAFRGDLTREWRAHNPDVEPASVLLERIRTERKARLIEDAAETARAKAEAKARDAGKPWGDADDQEVLEKERAKAEKKYKEPEPVDATDLPELPEGWCWAGLGQLALINSGEAFKKEDYGETGVRLLQIANVGFGRVLWESENFLPVDFAAGFDHLSLEAGDVVLALNRPIIKDRLKVALLREEDQPSILYQRVGRLRFTGLCDASYEFYYLQGPEALRAIKERLQGSDQPYLNTSLVPGVCVPLAPVVEQEAIMERLSEFNDLFSSMTLATIAAEKEQSSLTQSILAKAFRGQLVPQDPNDEPASVLLERIRSERAAADTQAKPKKKAARKAPKKTAKRKSAAKASP